MLGFSNLNSFICQNNSETKTPYLNKDRRLGMSIYEKKLQVKQKIYIKKSFIYKGFFEKEFSVVIF